MSAASHSTTPDANAGPMRRRPAARHEDPHDEGQQHGVGDRVAASTERSNSDSARRRRRCPPATVPQSTTTLTTTIVRTSTTVSTVVAARARRSRAEHEPQRHAEHDVARAPADVGDRHVGLGARRSQHRPDDVAEGREREPAATSRRTVRLPARRSRAPHQAATAATDQDAEVGDVLDERVVGDRVDDAPRPPRPPRRRPAAEQDAGGRARRRPAHRRPAPVGPRDAFARGRGSAVTAWRASWVGWPSERPRRALRRAGRASPWSHLARRRGRGCEVARDRPACARSGQPDGVEQPRAHVLGDHRHRRPGARAGPR